MGHQHGIHSVIHKDSASINTCAHLASWATERREELSVDQRRLLVLEPARYVSGEPEIGILINGARNQRGDFLDLVEIRSEDVRKGGGESCASLDGCEVHFPNVVTVYPRLSFIVS